MRLDRVTAELRSRSPWEAVDLGVVLLRGNAGALYFAWFLLTLPVLLAACGLTVWSGNSLLGLILLWWLKPVYDRGLLHVVSRALFGEMLPASQLLREVPRAAFGAGAAAGLLWRRLSLVRSFVLPLWQLERLRGRRLADRYRVVRLQGGATAAWLTILGLHLEFAINLGIGLFALFLLPQQVAAGAIENLMSADALLWVELTSIGLAYTAVSIIEPLYVTSGFGLYLNRRTDLEAWDIEIKFRRLVERRRRRGALATVLLVCLTLPLLLPRSQALADEVEAGDGPTMARIESAVGEVFDAPEFGSVKTDTVWKLKNSDPQEETEELRPFGFAAGLARMLEWLLWVAVVSLLIVAAVRGARWLPRWRRAEPRPAAAPAPASQLLVDTPRLLPADIVAEVRRLIAVGQGLAALSLLYRGSVAALQLRFGLEVTDSATEDECLRAAAAAVDADVNLFFRRVTLAWQRVAYAGTAVSMADIEQLCDGWSRHFGARR